MPTPPKNQRGRANTQRISRADSRSLKGIATSWTGEELKDSGEGMRARVREWEDTIRKLSEDLEKLRAAFERHYRGVDTRAPGRERMALEREIRRFSVPNGAPARVKFSFQNLIQRLSVLRSYWQRMDRIQEQGGYRIAPPPPPATPDKAQEKPKRKEKPKAKQKTPADPAEDRKLYKDFVMATRAIGAADRIPSYAAFQGSLEKQREANAKRGEKAPSFEVETKGDSVRLVTKK
ncbi:MAG: hypothetical protein CMH54_11675 [Myxococcales bacterium]|nr:hypothetical protein [Myxococcales bacterium]